APVHAAAMRGSSALPTTNSGPSPASRQALAILVRKVAPPRSTCAFGPRPRRRPEPAARTRTATRGASGASITGELRAALGNPGGDREHVREHRQEDRELLLCGPRAPRQVHDEGRPALAAYGARQHG